MSAPKKPQEEGSHSAPLKRSLEETVFCGVSGKHAAPVNNDYHLPFELGSDGRMTKVQRTEPSDLDKRSPLLHWVSSSPSSYVEHSSTTGTRSELRNPKDARDVKIESREARSEIREFHSDLRMETPVGKAKLEVRLDNRANEKDLRSDRGSYTDFKSDGKLEKDSHAAASSHINWKESKEHHKGKRHESSLDNQELWRVGRHGLPNTGEVVISRPEEWDSSEVHEAVGENKIDMKGEEKFREKDRKRKEEKHKDDKDRIDRRSMQLGEASIERKELPREEKETERWERERKDAQREKERDDKENNPIKRGSPNASEKENWHHGKEMLDGSVRSEQETVTLEQKKHKDDNWKADRELEDKKKEREAEMGDNHEQCGKSYDKESEDGFIEGDGVTERDRDAFGNGYQHHRRMIRKRGTAQTPNRDPRFRTRARENEGSQVETEVSNVVYKAGECLQELLKSWQEFKASQEVKNDETCQNYPTLEIRIPAEYVTSSNRQVKGAQLWGTEIYTNDSDLVAVLMHTGYCRPTSSPPAGIQELKATVRILPPQEYYASTLRNNVRSRAWGAGIGCSFRVEHCCIVKKDGGTIDLEPRLSHISALEPTLAPVFVERTMTTRSAASNALRQLRFVREVSIQYNLCNEPWLKYSISIVADKGLKKPLYTSARLKKGEVLYFETHSNRYELCYNGEKTSGTGSTSAEALEPEQEKRQNHNPQVQNGERNLAERENTVDVFRWSRCKKILPEEVMLSNGIPSRLEDLEVIEDNLEWEDLLWSQTGVLVGGKTYTLARVQFLAPKKK